VVDELLELCRTKLTKIKVPVAIHVVETIPKNPLGKFDKPTLRQTLHY
jgi:long-chain acyl-CoA synthetase